MQRRVELDAARGLMLVWMTTTHLPTVLNGYSNQPFGFVSASEGFIFLSALFTGLIYSRLAERNGFSAMRWKLGMRTVRLYAYHAGLLAFVFLVAVPIASHGNRPALHNLLNFYFVAGPARAITEAALLIYRPPLLDILPMYVIFLILTPVALAIGKRIGWVYMLGASVIVWGFAQFGLRESIYNWSQLLGFRIPLNEMGSFDLWGWQLCWILGLWCGVLWAKGNWNVEERVRPLTIPSTIIVLVFLAIRYAIPYGFELQGFAFLFDKWHLGLARIVDFFCVAVLLIRFQSFLRPLAVRPLIMLGQCSIQVFCVHLLFCFGGLTLLGTASMLSSRVQASLFVTTLAAMLLTAKIFAKSEQRTERGQQTFPPLSIERLQPHSSLASTSK
jgi:hypothetical protein